MIIRCWQATCLTKETHQIVWWRGHKGVRVYSEGVGVWLEWNLSEEKNGTEPRHAWRRERQRNAWETPLLNEEAFFLSVTVTFVLQRMAHIDAQTPTQSDVPIAVEHRLLTENLITASVRSLISSYPSQLTPLISISSLFTFLEDWIWCDIIAQCGGLFDRSR